MSVCACRDTPLLRAETRQGACFPCASASWLELGRWSADRVGATLRTMHPTGVARAVSVFATAPRKVPFFLAGGLLAGWAVLLGLTGLRYPGAPGLGGTGAARDAD
jgi:hypothetical protein